LGVWIDFEQAALDTWGIEEWSWGMMLGLGEEKEGEGIWKIGNFV